MKTGEREEATDARKAYTEAMVASSPTVRETELSLLHDRFRNASQRLARIASLSEASIGGVLGYNIPDETGKQPNDPDSSCFLHRMSNIADTMEGDLSRIEDQVNRL